MVSLRIALPHTIKLGAAKKAIKIDCLLFGYNSNNNVTNFHIHQKDIKLKKNVVIRYELKVNRLKNVEILTTINVSGAFM